MTRVLVGIPTYHAFLKHGIIERHLTALTMQTGRPLMTIRYIVNNTEAEDVERFREITETYRAEVVDFGAMRFPDELEELWNFLRGMTLAEQFDYLWIIGGDNRPIPETHLETLLRVNQAIVASPCFLKDAQLPVTNIFDPDRHDNFQPYLPAHELPLNQAFKTKYGMGTASILIKREVLEKVHFRSQAGTICFTDWQFSEDSIKNGFEIWSTTELWVNHQSDITGREASLATKFPYLAGEFEKWREKLNWEWWKYA